MSFLLKGLAGAMGMLFFPLRMLPDAAALSFLSLAAGALCTLGYGRISSQAAIRQAARQSQAGLLRALVYRHDLIIVLSSLGLAGAVFARRMLLALIPAAVLALPFMLLWGQLELHYGYRPPAAAQPLLVAARAEAPEKAAALLLQTAAQTSPSAGFLRRDSREVVWRVDAVPQHSSSRENLTIRLLDESAGSLIHEWQAPEPGTGPNCISRSFWSAVFRGADRVLPADLPVEEICVLYPERSYSVAGRQMHWAALSLLCVFFSSIVTAYLGGIRF